MEIDYSVGRAIIMNPSSFSKKSLIEMERAARCCYGSENKMTEGSAAPFLKRKIAKGHWSVLEMGGNVTFKCIAPRSICDQFTRHRHSSFLVASTRYRKNWAIMMPPVSDIPGVGEEEKIMIESYKQSIKAYAALLDCGVKNDYARSVLPLAIRTEFTVSSNIRQWFYLLDLRMRPAAHFEFRYLCSRILDEFMNHRWLSLLFDDFDTKMRANKFYIEKDETREIMTAVLQ